MDYLKQHYEQQAKRLKAKGFRNLTQVQKDVILQPEEAPENYMCDGEITPRQALASWKQRLKNSGLNQADVQRAINYHFKS